MTFLELAKSRRSVRVFQPKPVDEQTIADILEAANIAPSAGNLQAYDIYVVRSEAVRRKLAAAALGQDFLIQAPAALVFCASPARNTKYGGRGAVLYSVQDATVACTFAMLRITELGLATVWVGAFEDEAVRRAIGAPEGMRPVAILPVGYAGESPQFPGRRALAEHIHHVE